MGYMMIDGRKIEFTDEKNVLSVIRKAGINIPTLCYHSEVSTFGACRLCMVEDERGKMFASCSEEPRDGMTIYTNSGRIQEIQEADRGAASGGSLPRLYYLCEKRRVYSPGAGTSSSG